jgi:hypothetical protein
MQQTNHQASNKSIWWWAYFALNAGAYFASMFITWRWAKDEVSLSLFYGVGVVGLGAYLRGFAIWRRWFWAAYAYITYIGAALSIGGVIWQAAHTDALLHISLLLVATAFALPLWVALWRYAFRSPDVWAGISTAA